MLVRWEPFGGLRRRGGNLFSELNEIQREMNRLFDDFFGERQSGLTEGAWTPAVDVSENEATILVRAELPGMKQEDIEVDLQDNVLTIKGEKKKETKEDQENFQRVERSYGSFSRTFTLPANVKPEDIKATFKDGVLEISLPKAEEAKTQKIAITAGS